jgi:hypothetical protein
MEQFENDDEFGYQDWIWHVRHGFVLMYRAGSPEPDNLVLHSAKCWMIAPRQSALGYGKACSEVRAELEALAERWGGAAKPHDCLRSASLS